MTPLEIIGDSDSGGDPTQLPSYDIRPYKQLYHQDYHKGSNKFHIKWYETNKIRKLLARYYNTGGYPVRDGYHVGYYSGIAVWVQDQWMIQAKQTRKMWLEFPYTKWTHYVILKIDLYDTLEQELSVKFGKSLASLFGFSGGTENVSVSGSGMIGGIIDQVELNNILNTQKTYPIYPNLLFYNTINDVVIWANWNLVLKDLNKIEELKYLPPESEVLSSALTPIG